MKCKLCLEKFESPLLVSTASSDYNTMRSVRVFCDECIGKMAAGLKRSLIKSGQMIVRDFYKNFGVLDSKIDELFKESPPLWFFRGE